MRVMHYPLGTLSRPGGVELFLATTYAVAYEDPGIAKNVRAALASQFTLFEHVDPVLAYRTKKVEWAHRRHQRDLEKSAVASLQSGPLPVDGKVVVEADFTGLEMMLQAQLAQEIRDGKL